MVLAIVLTSCDGTRRDPGRAYMPDMAYSTAYETYAPTDRLEKKGVHFTGRPVEGTIARGDMMAYSLKNDSLGYVQSAAIKNPLAPGMADLKNAERLYLINCGICHGADLKGNGPLYKGGNGPFAAKPATLVGDAKYEAMPEGQMYYSVTYGKNLMGSYASQLTRDQRWAIIHYIKSKQAKAAPATAPAKADSTASVKK